MSLSRASLALFVMLVGCAASQATTPRSRIAKDLGCSTEGTTVQEIERVPDQTGARWQVRGCGKTAVYVCTLPVRDCWREGEIRLADPTITQ